ncbi:unnamed protein product, partial [Iphiclides podalirius]
MTDRCKQWVKVVGKEDLVHLPIEKLHGLRYICGDHLKKRDFTKTKTRLKRKAIPSVGLTMEPLSDDLFEEFPLHVYRSSQDGPEMVACYHKQWLLVRKKLHHQSQLLRRQRLQLRRLRKRVETLEGRSREGNGKT